VFDSPHQLKERMMSRKPSYLGGSTVVSDRDKSWFTKQSTKIPPDNAAKPRSRSAAGQRAFDEFAGQKMPATLLRPSDVEDLQKRRSKDRTRRLKLPPKH
jgi:hypothetical protein